MLTAQLATAENAFATTDFDNVIKTGGNFNVSYKQTGINGYSACGTAHVGDLSADLQSNWSTYITDPTKYIVSNPSQVSDSINAYDAALESGSGWGVVQHTSNMQYNNPTNTYLDVGSKYLVVWWSASSNLNFYHNTDGGYNALTFASNSNPVYMATLAYGVTSSNTCDIVARMQVINPGWHYNPEIITDVTPVQNPNLDTYAIAFLNSNILYPEGYVGDPPPLEYTPPTPTKILYTGTIDCGGVMPVAMSIDQPDNIGAADLTQLSLGRAQWAYNLTSDPYSFTVDCGDGKLATPYGAVDPASSSNDWICDISSTQPYHCALS